MKRANTPPRRCWHTVLTPPPGGVGIRACVLTFTHCSYTCVNTQISQVFTCINTTLRSCLHSVSTPLLATVHTCVNTTFDVCSHLIFPKFLRASRMEPPNFFALRAEDADPNPSPSPTLTLHLPLPFSVLAVSACEISDNQSRLRTPSCNVCGSPGTGGGEADLGLHCEAPGGGGARPGESIHPCCCIGLQQHG